MRSKKEIQQLAKSLSMHSLDQSGHIDLEKVQQILLSIQKGDIIEKTYVVPLLQYYRRGIKNAFIEDSVSVTTAIEIPTHEMRIFDETLKKRFKKKYITFSQDPDVIAGIKVQSGWDIIDNTIKRYLTYYTS